MTHCSEVSLETKFSERRVPHGSEDSFIRRQKALAASRAGMPCADARVAASVQRATHSPRRMKRAIRIMIDSGDGAGRRPPDIDYARAAPSVCGAPTA